MKRIIGVLSIMLGASGCFLSEGGAVSASWSISVGGAASTCDAVGGHTVEVISTRVSSGTTYSDLYDCVDYRGTTSDMRPGLYDVVVRLYDRQGNQLSTDFPVEVDVNSNDTVNAGSFDFAFQGNGGGGGGGGKGKFKASWVVSINGTDTTCADVGASLFEIVTNEGTSGGFQRTFSFPCSAFTATTEEVPAGTYVVSLRLLDANRAMLNSVPVGATVPLAAGETKDLGDYDFSFTFRAASFRVKMGANNGGNCKPSTDQGAAVVQQEIHVTSPSRMQCIALPVAGVLDGNGAVTSTSTCTQYDCQAETTNQVLRKLQTGSYEIRVFGYRTDGVSQSSICYVSNKIAFTVGDRDVDLGTIVAAFDKSYDSRNLCGAP